ncbi:MAG: hypothetical protein LQ342_007700 [Letrouitia transgressa]|nr:MAG: hypothetical protein LQ342_007700 [Letrouitia transgressa]
MLPFATLLSPDELKASINASINASIKDLLADLTNQMARTQKFKQEYQQLARKQAQKRKENARKRLVKKRSKQHAQKSPTEPSITSLPTATPPNLHVEELGNTRGLSKELARKACVITIKSTFTVPSNVNMMLMEFLANQKLGLAVPDIRFVELMFDWKRWRKKVNDDLEHSQIAWQEGRCVP